MRLRHVIMMWTVMGCGGGGGDGYPTGNNGGPGSGTGNPPGSGSGAPSASATVAMQSSDDGYGSAVFSFSPAAVSVTRGGTVSWSNACGTVAHNVTFASATGVPANIASFTTGSVSRSFPTAGAFSYECTNHAGMTGTVNVQ